MDPCSSHPCPRVAALAQRVALPTSPAPWPALPPCTQGTAAGLCLMPEPLSQPCSPLSPSRCTEPFHHQSHCFTPLLKLTHSSSSPRTCPSKLSVVGEPISTTTGPGRLRVLALPVPVGRTFLPRYPTGAHSPLLSLRSSVTYAMSPIPTASSKLAWPSPPTASPSPRH